MGCEIKLNTYPELKKRLIIPRIHRRAANERQTPHATGLTLGLSVLLQ